MENKESFLQAIKNSPLEDATKGLIIQVFFCGYYEGKTEAFKEALDLISFSKEKNERL